MISGQYSKSVTTCVQRIITLSALFACCFAGQTANAQFPFNNNRVGVVGGVSVDAKGTVRGASQQERAGVLRKLRESIQSPAETLGQQTQLRMISLSKLQMEVANALENNQQLPEEILYLAGLQRIEYIFVYPEQNDIVLAGPAEGWKVRQDATVVGQTSGRPVLQLEDLLVALRTTEASLEAPISVSIEPTPEGQRNLTRLLNRVRTGPGFNPTAIEPAMRKAFGPQQVKLTTVATDSRMAQTLVAADYHMKRIAMKLDDSPVAGLPSYMDMIRNGGMSRGTQPRWWMACDYDSISHSEDRLAWKINGLGIKAMTENEFVDASGNRTGNGETNKQAQQWANNFTSKFDELCKYNAAFGDLRNLMDLNIVATVIHSHELEHVAGCDFGLLRGENGQLETPQWQTPRTLEPECSFVKGTKGWTVSASGGVELNPWKIVSQDAKSDETVKATYVKAQSDRRSSWWWDK